MKRILLFLVVFISSLAAWSYDYDFSVISEDVTFYYKMIDAQNHYVSVTYGEKSYAGDVVIPSKVKYGTIDYTVRKIGNNAFRYNKNLKSITIPNSVVSVAYDAFEGCTSLTSVTLDCNSFVSADRSSDAVYHRDMAKIFGDQVKEYIIGNSVKRIGNWAFYDCPEVTSVTIGDSVTSIGYANFFGNKKFTSFIIPNSVTSIEDYAFSFIRGSTSGERQHIDLYINIVDFANNNIISDRFDNTHLHFLNVPDIKLHYLYDGKEIKGHLAIPDSVTKIGEKALKGCTGLTSITIPNSVTRIESDSFDGCTNLREVHISDLAAWCGIDFVTTTANPLQNAHHLYLDKKEITSLIIPDSVTSIKSFAFLGCSGLTSVTIPNSVTSIGGAFDGCTNLREVHISDLAAWCGISFGGTTANPLQNAHHLYLDKKEITSLIIPDSITSIKSFAFLGCSGLTSVTISNSVKRIGEYAFNGCTGLTSITIPKSVTDIAWEAFSDCSYLASVTLDNDSFVARKREKDSKNMRDVFGNQVKEYIIGNSVKSIGDYAFYNCSGVKSLVIGNSVTSIGDNALTCLGLTSVTLDNNYIVSYNRGGYNNYMRYVFGNQVKEYIIGNSVESIGEFAFCECENLKSITISNSVKYIGKDAFIGCTGLTSVIIPNSVTRIGWGAFTGCTGLTSVTIPNSVTSIRGGAFYNCSGLTSVIIPNSVTTIEQNAFTGCTGLTSVTIPNSVTTIEPGAFKVCTRLKSIIIPKSVTSIGSNVFTNCSGLKTVIFSGIVTNIASTAFAVSVTSGSTEITAIVPYRATNNYKNGGFKEIIELHQHQEDVNGDKKTNTADVVAVYANIINGNESGIMNYFADANLDGKVNTADVVAIYNAIINGGDSESNGYLHNFLWDDTSEE